MERSLLFSAFVLALVFVECHLEKRVHSARFPSWKARINGKITSVVSMVEKVEGTQEAQSRDIQDIRGKDMVQDDDLKDIEQDLKNIKQKDCDQDHKLKTVEEQQEAQRRDLMEKNSILWKLWKEVKNFREDNKERKKEIGDIRTKLTNIETKFVALNSTVTELKTTFVDLITELKAKFVDLNKTVTELKADFVDLNNTVTELENKIKIKAAFNAFRPSINVEAGPVQPIPEIFDFGDNYDDVAAIFTAPCRGIYTFTVCARFIELIDGSDLLELKLARSPGGFLSGFPIQVEEDAAGFFPIQCNTYIEECAENEGIAVIADVLGGTEVRIAVAFAGSLIACLH